MSKKDQLRGMANRANQELDSLYDGGSQLDNFIKDLQQSEQPAHNLNQIIANDDGSLTFRGWQLTQTGLTAPSDTTIEDYQDLGRLLLRLEGSLQWLLGDWLKEGENFTWGETYVQIAEEFGYDPHTLKVYKNICNHVQSYIRMYDLSFGHHQIIAPFSENPAVQKALLETAAHYRWSIAAFRKHIKSYRPLILEAIKNQWSAERFAGEAEQFQPERILEQPDRTPKTLWENADLSWGTIRGIGTKIESGELPTDRQRIEAREKIKALQEYLVVLDQKLDKLEP